MTRRPNRDGNAVVVGLNPAVQKSLLFEKLEFGEVNRAENVDMETGGKGVNFARAAQTWDQPVLLYQFAGGDTGKLICQIMDDSAIPHHTVFTDTPTRICTTCLCRKSGTMTELIEPSGLIPPDRRDELLADILEAVPDSAGVAICGSFPPGIDKHFYGKVVACSRKNGVPVLLDACREIDASLEKGVDIFKINKDELSELSGQSNVPNGIRYCFDRYQLDVVAITDGPNQAFLGTRDSLYHLTIPKIENVINPLGAGDTVSAVMFSEYLKGTDPAEAFAFGLAAGSASCMKLKVADYDPATARQLKEQIRIEPI